MTVATIEPLLTVPDLASLLGIPRKGVYTLVEHNKIPFIKIANRLRFDPADVKAWLVKNRIPARDKQD